MSGDGYRVGVLGATGLVGTTILELLAARGFPVVELRPLASERSVGKEIEWDGSAITVQELERGDDPGDLDIVLSSAGGSISAEWTPKIVDAGAVVVDNTSYWRMDDDVPLVVAEVNPDAADAHNGIIANPNCSTMQMVVALKPLFDEAGIERLVVSTYQAVSGHRQGGDRRAARRSPTRSSHGQEARRRGLPAPDRLQRAAPGGQLRRRRRPHRRGAQDDQRDPQDPRRPGDPGQRHLRPGAGGHRPLGGGQRRDRASLSTPSARRELLAAAPGVTVVDDPAAARYPMAIDAAGSDDVFVGRIRRDPGNESALDLWIVSDNLRKGAATNAVQVAELLIERDLLGPRD